MNKLLRTIACLPAIIFLIMGLSWLTQPKLAAQNLGLPLLDGVARSSQIGDMSAFFLSLSAMIFFGIMSQTPTWFRAAALLLGLTALGRILAWLLHSAALPVDLIAPEVIFSALLLVVASFMPKES